MIVTNFILEPKKQNLVRVEKNLCSLQAAQKICKFVNFYWWLSEESMKDIQIYMPKEEELLLKD